MIKEDKKKLFELIKKLNARQQYSMLAQKLLAEVLPQFNPDQIVDEFKDSKQLSEMIEAMLMYSEKHYSRAERHHKQNYFVHFVMGQMTLQEDTRQLEQTKTETDRKRDHKKKLKAEKRERKISSGSL